MTLVRTVVYKSLCAALMLGAATFTPISQCEQEAQAVPENRARNTVEIVIISKHSCFHCKKMVIEELQKLAGTVSVRVIYADTPSAAREVEQKYGIKIQAFPTTLVVVNGKAAQSFVGYRDAAHWWATVNKNLLA